jgi:hypothetical protein
MSRFNVVVERQGVVERATIPVEAENAEAAAAMATTLGKHEWCFAWVPYGPASGKVTVVKAVAMIQPEGEPQCTQQQQI